MDFRARGEYNTMLLEKAAGVTIEAGDLVALSAGLAIKATATSAKVAFCPQGAASADLKCEVTVGQVDLIGDSSNVFAESQRGTEYDIAVSGAGKQTINQSGTTYKVLMMDESQDAGTVDAATNVKVRINKPISERA